jgi:hypothetical protein
MSNHIHRSIQEPEREGLTWEEVWRGHDKGLVKCWEVGRSLRKTEPELAARARDGELPILLMKRNKSESAIGDEDDESPIRLWKGGVGEIPKKQKYGTLNYLAAWQGLRGDDLDIDLSEERGIVCTRTGVRVIFTADVSKWSES